MIAICVLWNVIPYCWNIVPFMSRYGMTKKKPSRPRREDALSRDQIVSASIEILDRNGEDGLTFRALSERLATGPGALYWHIANKGELLSGACDAIVARVMNAPVVSATPEAIIRTIALGLFDAINAHPWIGSALTHSPAQLPAVRILESIGQQVRALGVPHEKEWATVGALLSYILGVGGQNAANRQFAHAHNLNRSNFLNSVAAAWSELDPDQYPFARSMAGQLRAHNDRADFLAGIDLILRGIEASQHR
jgi:AcrR family transcriptional regulator